jgi:16S rRNA (adenine1518-N6/adenine1519-N6)-dimethyltransferase
MRKSPAYGQHFLHDRNILAAIVSAAELGPEDAVLEIGIGTGRLTELILEEGVSVTGVEVDPKLLAGLEEKFRNHAAFRLVPGDVLRLSWEELLMEGRRVVLMGNLPYAVSTQVLFRAIAHRALIQRAVFLLQWEVGVRMAADPGTRDYGILSVACQMFGKPEVLRKVPPSVFLPPPKVDSALVRWSLYERAAHDLLDEQFTMKVVRAAFGQRRKKLVNSLSAGIPEMRKEKIKHLLVTMGMKETVRAEELTVEQFAELANKLFDAGTRGRGDAETRRRTDTETR